MIAMIASVFTACQSKSDLNTTKDILTDTSAMYRSNIMTDTGSVIQTQALSNGNTLNSKTVATHTTSTNTAPARNRNYSTTRSTGSGQTTRTVYRKKGWSHAAKDAVIGGVGGAVVGAVVGKGKGAVIGGVVGAGGGYILGRAQDKKEGRVK